MVVVSVLILILLLFIIYWISYGIKKRWKSMPVFIVPIVIILIAVAFHVYDRLTCTGMFCGMLRGIEFFLAIPAAFASLFGGLVAKEKDMPKEKEKKSKTILILLTLITLLIFILLLTVPIFSVLSL